MVLCTWYKRQYTYEKNLIDWLIKMKSNYKGKFCVVGAFLIFLTFGSVYTFGNVMPYIVSYMRVTQNLNITYRFVWISYRSIWLTDWLIILVTLRKLMSYMAFPEVLTKCSAHLSMCHWLAVKIQSVLPSSAYVGACFSPCTQWERVSLVSFFPMVFSMAVVKCCWFLSTQCLWSKFNNNYLIDKFNVIN